MYLLNVNKKYNIYIENSFDRLKDLDIRYNNIFIISDENVDKYYLKSIVNIFQHKNISFFVINSGEESKNLNTIYDIYTKIVYNFIDRKSLIISLGGGVVGDIAGFVASTYMRGIDYIQIPTTLLSMVDSSIGGKTGVDFLGKKNIIGSFYNPKLVYINLETLETLPQNEFENGMAEIIKHAYILDKEYLKYIIDNKEEIYNKDKDILANLIYKSCQIKSKIVSLDEKEIGIREILNFGHTFGHAIETESNFKIMHGKAISYGIIASMYISFKRGYINFEDIDRAKKLLRYFNLYQKMSINIENIYNHMIYDKKNNNKKIRLIILEEISKAKAIDDIYKEEIIEAIKFSLEG